MILEHDRLETAFEIRATPAGGEIHRRCHILRLMHNCVAKMNQENIENEGVEEVELNLSWVRCPWCSKQVPERIRRIFRQK